MRQLIETELDDVEKRREIMSDPEWIDTHIWHRYTLPAGVDEVSIQLKVRPVGLDLLDELIATGDLDSDGSAEVYVANMYSKMGRRIIDYVNADRAALSQHVYNLHAYYMTAAMTAVM